MNTLGDQAAGLQGADALLGILIASAIAFALLACAFVAAALLLRWRNLRKQRRWDALEANWESLLLDYLGGDIDAVTLRTHVSAPDALYFVDFLSRYASRLRGTERERIGEVASPYLPRIEAQLRARLPGVRARAVRTLSLLGLTDYSYGIIAALDDPSPFVAMTAARALSRREQPEFAAAVLLKLHRFSDWSPAFLSAMLAGIGASAAPYLRGTFRDEREPAPVRIVAADALRALGDLAVADAAADVARKSGDRNLTAAALRLLRTCGRAPHAAVARLLAAGNDEVVRAQAIGALGTLGDARDVPLLVAALDDSSIWVAWHAAGALLAVGARTTLESMVVAGHARSDVMREVLAAPL